ncbi:MAG TPA: hypothetical protein VFT64_09840 [Rickettsiales bacterium]|nr:hypothetical protein [Rickettsiales bacterium]
MKKAITASLVSGILLLAASSVYALPSSSMPDGSTSNGGVNGSVDSGANGDGADSGANGSIGATSGGR